MRRRRAFTLVELLVVIGIIAVNLPFRGLSLQAVIEGIDRAVEEAAFSLGAAPMTMFRRVLWPLALILVLAVPFAWRVPWRGLPFGAKSLLLPVLALAPFALCGDHIDYPALRGFNIAGGIQVVPELLALWAGLTIYASAFIAEIVRAGILAVSWGQSEAASALGLRPGQCMRLIVLPQALRVIVPPMTSEYLSLTKNSSLAVAIGYPDLVSIANTTMNQTGQAVEGIAMIMAVYLAISLLISLFMNLYNRAVALVER